MVHMGFSFAVHPEVFAVHYPHEDSKDQGLVKATVLMQQVGHLLFTHSPDLLLSRSSLTHSLTLLLSRSSLTHLLTQSPTQPPTYSLLTPLLTRLLACAQRNAMLLKDAVMCTALSVLVCGADTSHDGCMRHIKTAAGLQAKLMLKDSLCHTEITADSAQALPCLNSDHTFPSKTDILTVGSSRCHTHMPLQRQQFASCHSTADVVTVLCCTLKRVSCTVCQYKCASSHKAPAL